MAISKNNPLTKGASGMIGNAIVFRSWNGKTYMYNRPSKPKKESALQKENRTKFSRAVAFARRMMSDAAKKAEYKEIAKSEKLPNAYTAAVTEYMRKPEIEEIDTSRFGKAGSEIKVTAKKKGFELQVVEVIILDENGNVVDGGNAKQGAGDEWIYSASSNHTLDKAFQIKVIARDRINHSIERIIKISPS
jgi:hypothetical protein